MTVLNLELTQIEIADLPVLKSILASDFRKFTNINKELTSKEIEEYITSLNTEESYCFGIKASKDNEYKKMLIGFCAITHIDWINSHGELLFMMVDKSGYTATIQNHASSKAAFSKLLKFGFGELNLHKLWIEILSGNDVTTVLEEFGFVAEGVRRASKYKNGKYIDTTICSIVAQDFNYTI